jgi:hypothetical protein
MSESGKIGSELQIENPKDQQILCKGFSGLNGIKRRK